MPAPGGESSTEPSTEDLAADVSPNPRGPAPIPSAETSTDSSSASANPEPDDAGSLQRREVPGPTDAAVGEALAAAPDAAQNDTAIEAGLESDGGHHGGPAPESSDAAPADSPVYRDGQCQIVGSTGHCDGRTLDEALADYETRTWNTDIDAACIRRCGDVVHQARDNGIDWEICWFDAVTGEAIGWQYCSDATGFCDGQSQCLSSGVTELGCDTNWSVLFEAVGNWAGICGR